MKDQVTLKAKRINYGQSLIWLENEGKELTPTRTIATNEVNNAARRYCTKEVFEEFYEQYNKELNNVASLSIPKLDEIAIVLKLTV